MEFQQASNLYPIPAYVSEGKDEVENAQHRWLFHVIEAIGRP